MVDQIRIAAPRLVVPALIASALASGLAGCGEQATADREAPPRVVRVEIVRLAPLAEAVHLTGTVRARYETPMAFRVAGKIERRLVDAGARVKAGDLLATLDPADYRLALAAADADVRAAEAEFARATADEQRAVQLLAKGHTSQAATDRVQTAARAATEKLAAARSQRQIAANRLAYAELRAGSDGVVTAVAAEPGQVVAEGRAVLTLAEDGAREAVVAVPESRLALAAGSRASVTLWALPGRSYAATLRELSPDADPVTRTFQARLSIADAGPEVALGMTAHVTLTPPNGAKVASLPTTAVWWRGEQAMVWVVDAAAGRLVATPVTIAKLASDHVAVAGALADGDRVVAMGVHRLDESLPVRVAAQ